MFIGGRSARDRVLVALQGVRIRRVIRLICLRSDQRRVITVVNFLNCVLHEVILVLSVTRSLFRSVLRARRSTNSTGLVCRCTRQLLLLRRNLRRLLHLRNLQRRERHTSVVLPSLQVIGRLKAISMTRSVISVVLVSSSLKISTFSRLLAGFLRQNVCLCYLGLNA